MLNSISGQPRQAACHRCGTPAPLALAAFDTNRHLSEQEFDYFLCPKCELFFLDPLPTNLSQFYAGGYQEIPESLSELRKLAMAERYRLEPILTHCRGGDLLEVGPWIGLFSINAKDAGFNVDTIEMNPVAVEFLRDTVGVGVTQSDDAAATLDARDKLYDVIVFWHSLEHLPAPWDVIRAAAQRLKPKGILLIAVPNIAGDQAKRFGASWYHLDAPRHIYFWSPDALVAMCTSLSLRLATITTNDRLSRDLSKSADNLHVFEHIKLRYVRGIFALIFSTVRDLCRRNSRDELKGAGITAIFSRADVEPVQTLPG
ncbi:class I SAM-dependent methyltransferase [Polymorphobacter sp. PAMC 29334]|uniref:class I SAM-dependent methyltransferase n=1 Tax=Polymorphobacter sp. PAMC 29334 TaxID=2862331 RepID=UPI001C678453|nr:class I SAM-dependent methyltransferase [Polymorphobacter sp. PAMC 29334]QYE35953.1 class I SAM-dependent methyltransferase [Polymorphobacter sp. PAMC 29334]